MYSKEYVGLQELEELHEAECPLLFLVCPRWENSFAYEDGLYHLDGSPTITGIFKNVQNYFKNKRLFFVFCLPQNISFEALINLKKDFTYFEISQSTS
jgi:hypothetical protein